MDFTTQNLDKSKATKIMEAFQYDREALLKKQTLLTEDITELEAQKNAKHIMFCRHNTILTLELTSTYDNSKKISHVITNDSDTNDIKVIPIGQVSRHLNVSRWEPKTAKEWLKEEFTLINPSFTPEENEEYGKNYKKVTMGEYDFREIILKDKKDTLAYVELSLKNEAYLSEILNSEDPAVV